MSLRETGRAISEVIYAFINAILEYPFMGDGLAAALGFIVIFVAFAVMWAWTQYLVTETAQDIREWWQKRKVMKDVQNAQRP